jgi:hypothetical protein
MEGKVLSSPPPEPSPVKGEENCAKVTRMKSLPLSAIKGKGERDSAVWSILFLLP